MKRTGQRGSILVFILLFLVGAAILLAASLRPLLMERASVERDHLRLVASELLLAGAEAVRAADAASDLAIAVPDLLDADGVRGGFTARTTAHERGVLAALDASVESPALRCTQSRWVVLGGPKHATIAQTDGPFHCTPRAR